jgi:hypothetical protein
MHPAAHWQRMRGAVTEIHQLPQRRGLDNVTETAVTSYSEKSRSPCGSCPPPSRLWPALKGKPGTLRPPDVAGAWAPWRYGDPSCDPNPRLRLRLPPVQGVRRVTCPGGSCSKGPPSLLGGPFFFNCFQLFFDSGQGAQVPPHGNVRGKRMEDVCNVSRVSRVSMVKVKTAV